MKKPLIAPSILSADWGRLNEEIAAVSEAGADWLHMDVMDGHFVPPITFGPRLVAASKRACSLVIDVHLMIEQPEKQIKAFADAGADIITVHYEAVKNLESTCKAIQDQGVKVGVSVKPATPISSLTGIIDELDLILVMSVNPGWSGQDFIPESLQKIAEAKRLIDNSSRDIDLEVDGGINEETAEQVLAAGANVLVSGSYIFGARDYAQAIASLRCT